MMRLLWSRGIWQCCHMCWRWCQNTSLSSAIYEFCENILIYAIELADMLLFIILVCHNIYVVDEWHHLQLTRYTKELSWFVAWTFIRNNKPEDIIHKPSISAHWWIHFIGFSLWKFDNSEYKCYSKTSLCTRDIT